MEEHNVHEYLHIGAMNWYLIRIADGGRANGKDSVQSAIKRFREIIDHAGLKVTVRAGEALWRVAEELEKLPANATLSAEMASRIREQAKFIEHTLVAEAEGKIVFVVTEKRIDINKLLNSPASLLSKDVWVKLPRISATDFSSGCKAIAFELPTAGAFYLLRSIEGALVQFYLSTIQRKRLPEKQRMWAAMVKQMREKKRDRPPEELLNVLDQIRVSFRNPTSHPEKNYNSEEAQDLFGLCVDALNRMVKSDSWNTPADCALNIFGDLKEPPPTAS